MVDPELVCFQSSSSFFIPFSKCLQNECSCFPSGRGRSNWHSYWNLEAAAHDYQPRNPHLKQNQISEAVTHNREDLACSQAGTTKTTPNPENLQQEGGQWSPNPEVWEEIPWLLELPNLVELPAEQRSLWGDRKSPILTGSLYLARGWCFRDTLQWTLANLMSLLFSL